MNIIASTPSSRAQIAPSSASSHTGLLQNGGYQRQQASDRAEKVRVRAKGVRNSAEHEAQDGLDRADQAIETAQVAGDGADEAAKADHDELQDVEEEVTW